MIKRGDTTQKYDDDEKIAIGGQKEDNSMRKRSILQRDEMFKEDFTGIRGK